MNSGPQPWLAAADEKSKPCMAGAVCSEGAKESEVLTQKHALVAAVASGLNWSLAYSYISKKRERPRGSTRRRSYFARP